MRYQALGICSTVHTSFQNSHLSIIPDVEGRFWYHMHLFRDMCTLKFLQCRGFKRS